MARGSSGRIVIDIDPDFKRGLHSALVADGLTMKEWFLAQASRYLENRSQPLLPGIASLRHADSEDSGLARKVAEEPSDYRAGRSPRSSNSETNQEP